MAYIPSLCLALVVFVIQVITLIVKAEINDPGRCKEHCNNHRPPGENGPYQVNCDQYDDWHEKNRCKLWCQTCDCNCPAKREQESSGESDVNNAGIGTVIIFIVGILLLCCICGGIAACVVCSRNRGRYPNVPIHQAGPYSTMPSTMMMPGAPMQYTSTTASYPQQTPVVSRSTTGLGGATVSSPSTVS